MSRRALNRALLARQHLIERVDWPAERMVAHLVGLQAQNPNPPYFGLWTRLRDFRTEELSALIETRRAVRISLMRGTIHLAIAADCLALRPLLASVHARMHQSTYGKSLVGVDLEMLAEAGRALVEERPRTFKELEELLSERWPGVEPRALAQAVRNYVPLAQVPPRGLWGQSGQAVHTSLEVWVGQPAPEAPDPDAIARRYLAAFGPASAQDIRSWSGSADFRDSLERMRPELLVVRDERGRELFDLPEAPRPDPDTPIPPRFVAEFDNLLLSHADRTRILADDHKPRVFTINGIIKGTILIDGFVAGTWKIVKERKAVVLEIEPFAPLAAADREALTDEGIQMLLFAASDATGHGVRISD